MPAEVWGQGYAFDKGFRIDLKKVPRVSAWRSAKVQTCRIQLWRARDIKSTGVI